MDTKTDFYAKSDSNSFPLAEKLEYYVEADGLLNSLIFQQQEDRGETEPTDTTVAGQSDYAHASRLHNTKWLKINYGNGFIPARYKPEADLIAQYGNELDGVLTSWPASSPIYFTKRGKDFVYPAPTAAQAGANRLKRSVELLPPDLDRASNATPTLVPVNFHYLHSAYAAKKWLDRDDPLWAKANEAWTEGVPLMLDTMYPRARQAEVVMGVPDDDGSEY